MFTEQETTVTDAASDLVSSLHSLTVQGSMLLQSPGENEKSNGAKAKLLASVLAAHEAVSARLIRMVEGYGSAVTH